MRKFILVLTCLIFIFSLLVAGCGRQEQEPAKTETPSEEMEAPPQETPTDEAMPADTMGEMVKDSAAAMEHEGGGE